METTWDFIISNPVVLIMVFIPITYLVIRDLSSYFLNKKKVLEMRRNVEAEENRVEEMYRKISKNRAQLIEDIKRIDASDPMQELRDLNEKNKSES